MKQALFLTASMLAVSPVLAQAPITISHVHFPATSSAVWHVQLGNVSGLNAPAPGSNQTWDYSMLRTSSMPMVGDAYVAPPSHPAFPAATIATTPFLDEYAAVRINTVRYQALTPIGVQELGVALPRQRLALRSATGGLNDSLLIPAQHTTYLGVYETALPMTAGTVNKVSYRDVWNGRLTVASFNLTQTPVRFVTRVQRTDSVAAWGTVIMPVGRSSSVTSPIPVLMRRRYAQQIDSIYVGNAPAPAALLALLNLQQGRTTTSYSDAFFRLNSSQALVTFTYDTPVYSPVKSAVYSSEPSLIALNARNSLAVQAAGVTAHPNPSSDGQLTIALGSGSTQALQLTVYDLAGRQVTTKEAVAGKPCPVLKGLRAGSYLVEVRNTNGLRSTVKVQVI